MAIQVKSVTKRESGTYVVSVQDTGDQTGVDDKGNPVYRTYSVVHNPVNSADSLKARIEAEIVQHKKLKSEEEAIISEIETTIKAIDTSKISLTQAK